MKRQGTLLRGLLPVCGLMMVLFLLSGWTFPSVVSAQRTGFIRIIHASPDVGVVDVFVDKQKLLSDFQYASVTQYVSLPQGAHDVQIALLGKGVNAAMLSQSISIKASETYTIAVLGTKETGFSFKVFTDNNSVSKNMISGSMAKLRVYHLSPGTNPVDIDQGTNAVIQNLSYPQASDYIFLPTGQHSFSLDSASQNARDTFVTTLKPWTVTSVFAIGQLNGSKKLQFVTAQVQGTPNLPNTGSDPDPLAAGSAPTNLPVFWLSALLVVAALGLGSGCFYLTSRRRK